MTISLTYHKCRINLCRIKRDVGTKLNFVRHLLSFNGRLNRRCFIREDKKHNSNPLKAFHYRYMIVDLINYTTFDRLKLFINTNIQFPHYSNAGVQLNLPKPSITEVY